MFANAASSSLLIVILAMLAAGGVFYAFAYPYLSGQAATDKRITTVAERKRVVRGSERVVDAAARRKQIADSLKEIEDKDRNQRKVKLEQRLMQAGLTIDKRRYFMFSALSGVVTALLLFIFSGKLWLAPAGLVVGAIGLPSWTLGFLRKRRINKFIENLPDAMDVITRGIKAGIPLGDCLRIVSVESNEPLKSEFRQVVEQQTMGLTLGEAVERMAERVPVTESNFLSIVINIQSKSGGNLSEALGNLSRVLRERRKMRGKISAMSMEAKASAAIIGSLPFVVSVLIYLTTPGYMALLFTTQAGNFTIAGALGVMFIGVMVMRNMIKFDI